MLKKILMLMFFSISVAGCDYELSQNDKIKWAVIQNPKIYNKILEAIKKDNPYPPELANGQELREELRLAVDQITLLENEARKKCVKSNKVEKNNGLRKDSNTIILPNGDQVLSSIEKFVQRSSSSRGDLTAISSGNIDAYRNCISKLDSDPHIFDLRNKVNKLNKLEKEINQFDENTSKKAKELFEKTIAEYGEKNKYVLILNRTMYSNNVAFNSDNVFIEVTDDVLEYFSQNQTSSKASR